MAKTCSVCGVEKDSSEFNGRKKSPDGLQPKCRACQKEQDGRYYGAHREAAKERARRWAQQNPGGRAAIESRYRRANRQQQNLRTQNYRARKRSATDGWEATAAWWCAQVERFDGRCAYCRARRKLTVDHVVPLSRGGRHSSENVVPACESCNYTKRDQTLDELGWTLYSPPESVRGLARAKMEAAPALSFQRAIREVLAEREGVPAGAPTTMDGAYVTPISAEVAATVILKYEWLGTMGRPQACYGLWLPLAGHPALAGVACFGFATGRLAGHVCGERYAHLAIALERGACVHWAPKNAASWFVPRACAAAARDRRWRVFYAYSDPAAREVGTVYQACNWLYLGVGPGHGPTRESWVRPDGVQVSSRALRYRWLTPTEAQARGWRRLVVPARGKYVWFEGSPFLKRALRRALVHPVQPYPKRCVL